MKESLTTRVGRIVSGSVSALVDAVENAVPEAVMEEAIREIDSAIDEVRAELGRVAANKHLANTRLAEENRKHEELGEKVDLAVKEARDDLAEAAIASQLDIEAQIPVLQATVAECGDHETELEGYIQALQAKRREMREDLREYRKSRQEPPGQGVPGAQGGATQVQGKVEKAASAFDRVLEEATGMGSTRRPVDRVNAARLAELEELARKNRIQERLAAVKGKPGTE